MKSKFAPYNRIGARIIDICVVVAISDNICGIIVVAYEGAIIFLGRFIIYTSGDSKQQQICRNDKKLFVNPCTYNYAKG